MKIFEKSLNAIVKCHGLEGFKDPFWNLGQILVWVETRSPFAVDMLSDTDALSERSHSMPPTMPHHAAEWAADCAKQYDYPQFVSPFSDAQQLYLAVLRHFQSGEFLALRPEAGSSERKPMSTMDWIDLTIGEDIYGEIVIFYRGASHATYRDVRVERAAVLRVFGPISFVDAAAPLNPEDVYRVWIAQNESENKIPPRGDCLAHMRKTFPDIDDHSVRALRKEHAPDTWKIPGRRKSS